MGFLATFGSLSKPPKAVKRTVNGKTLKSRDAEGKEVDVFDPDLCEDGVMDCNIVGGDQVKRTVHHSCKVTINGRESSVYDLRQGDQLVIDGQPAITIGATRPGAR